MVLTRRMSHSKLQTCITAQENAAKEQRKYQAKLLNLSCFQLWFVDHVSVTCFPRMQIVGCVSIWSSVYFKYSVSTDPPGQYCKDHVIFFVFGFISAALRTICVALSCSFYYYCCFFRSNHNWNFFRESSENKKRQALDSPRLGDPLWTSVIYLTFSCFSFAGAKCIFFLNFIYKVTTTIFKEKYVQGFSLFS